MTNPTRIVIHFNSGRQLNIKADEEYTKEVQKELLEKGFFNAVTSFKHYNYIVNWDGVDYVEFY